VKRALEPIEITLAAVCRFQAIGENRRPCMHRWIHIAEIPLVGGQLSAWMQIGAAQHQIELILAEVLIDEREGQDVEGKIPRRVPRVLPLVRHRDDVGVAHVPPMVVARRAVLPGAALIEPALEIVVVILLRPEHARDRLPHDVRGIRAQRCRDHARVELVRFAASRRHHLFEAGAEGLLGLALCRGKILRRHVREAQPQHARLSRVDADRIVHRCLRALPGRI
jgi:hypothetical protein